MAAPLRNEERHVEQHPLSGKTVVLGEHAGDPVRHMVEPGELFRVEDWWDRLTGGSWMDAEGNPAALQYAMRIGSRFGDVPVDDDVVYGKIGPYGHLVHASELGDEFTGDATDD
jgi:hypothetical protein